jgi:mannose-1-phosphate guanylyltransferase
MNTWALVLAAGEGSRLRTLTTRNGIAVPKQFCSLQGGPSLLQEALHRAEAVAPRRRICTVVAAQHRRWFEGPLWSLPTQNVIVQPENRGTATGLMLPLLHIAAREPDARIVVLPSDHYVRDEATLARSLRQAAARVKNDPDSLYLLGIEPEEADPELGYIVPGASDGSGALQVAQFVEKPSVTLARALIDRGGMWNAFILAASARALVELFARRYPEILLEMQNAAQRDLAMPGDAIAATDLYARLPELDFSRHVLEGAEQKLRVVPVPACGWSDLGTPRRVAETLARLARDEREVQDAASAFASTAYINLAAQHARTHLAV